MSVEQLDGLGRAAELERGGLLREHRAMYIGGEWVEGGNGAIEVIDPTREEAIAAVPAGTESDVARAVRAARAAQGGWAAAATAERARHLRALAERLQERAGEMAVTIALEAGSPITLCREHQVAFPIWFLRDQAEWIERIELERRVGHSLVAREPVGVVAAIAPWNFPLLLGVNKVAAALAAGCAVVLKPSEHAPLHALLLAEVAHEAGLPPGVLNVVTGAGPVVGEALVAHPDVAMVSLTGSTEAGRRVAQLAAASIKRVSLELGGKSASIVLDDADLAAAVAATVSQCYWNSGQSCMAWSRLLLPRTLYQEGARLAVAESQARTVGDPLNARTEIGPLISSAQRERVRRLIEDATQEGAELLCGGVRPPEGLERGFFVRPTVLGEVSPQMAIARQEVFGPVLGIMPYETEREAVAIANDTPYGLHGAVFSADVERATRCARQLQTGMVDVNGAPLNGQAPFGGRRQSGLGRELGRFGIEGYLEYKAIQLPAS